MVNDDLSAHRTRTNMRPVEQPAPTPPALVAAVNDVYDAGEWKL